MSDSTVSLYLWSKSEQIEELKRYLIQHTPSSASNLGFLMDMDPAHVNMWTSHSDPLCTTDTVVWICDYGEGVRVFLNSEFVFDQQATDSKEHEALYQQSIHVLQQVIKYYLSEKRKIDAPIFGDVHLLWLPVFYANCKLTLSLPHCRLAKQASLVPLTDVTKIPDHLERTKIETDEDIATVQANNKYIFSYDYIKKCSRLSSAIRKNDTKQLVAWAMTHPDFSIGALYVLPDYRRQGLAEAVVTDISRVHRNYLQNQLPLVSLSKLYLNVFIEPSNTSSLNLFKKSGFQHVSAGVSRIQIAGPL